MKLKALWRIATLILTIAGALPASTVLGCDIRSGSEPVAEGRIVYSTTGQGTRVLLLHGLFAQKEQWHAVMCALADQGYEVTAPDLPGYGQSDGFALSAYQLERQADLLHQFARQKQFSPLHIAGNSMGGAISALYAIRYPENVTSLAFIGGTLGVEAWAMPIRQAIFSGFNPFIPVTPEQFDQELALLLANPPDLDDSAKESAIQAYMLNNQHYQQVWNIVNLYGSVLLKLKKQTLPTLILWGEQDRVFDISGMPLLANIYPHNKHVALKDTGHLAMLDTPLAVAKHYGRFIQSIDVQLGKPRRFIAN